MTWAQVGAWRMERHYLLERASHGAMLAVVSRVCGVQAQVVKVVMFAPATVQVTQGVEAEAQRLGGILDAPVE